MGSSAGNIPFDLRASTSKIYFKTYSMRESELDLCGFSACLKEPTQKTLGKQLAAPSLEQRKIYFGLSISMQDVIIVLETGVMLFQKANSAGTQEAATCTG